MTSAVLIVERDDRVRASLRHAVAARNLPVYEVSDAFDAMSALGRADFGAIIASAGRRQLSLRGLCQLARRRHPDIRIFIIFFQGMAVEPVAEAIGVQFDVVAPGTTTTELAARIDGALRSRMLGFDALPRTLETDPGAEDIDIPVDDFEQTERMAPAPAAPPPKPSLTPPARAPTPVVSPVQPAPIDIPAVAAPVARAFFVEDSEPTEPHRVAPVFPSLDSMPPASSGGFAPAPSAPSSPARVAPAPPSPPRASPPPEASPFAPTVRTTPLVSHATPTEVDVGDLLFDVHAPELAVPVASSIPEGTVTETHVPAALYSSSSSTAEEEALFEGTLDGGGGPALLMSLMAQEFNGRLEVGGNAAAGVLYFFGGEPVWAVPADGDRGLFRRVVDKGLLARDAAMPSVVEGQLLSKLVEAGLLTGSAMHDFMRTFIREVVIAFAGATGGAYGFFESSSFLETIPLVKVNAFGLILEARRRQTRPEELLRRSGELEWKYLHPGPALVPAAPKLKAFVRSADLAELVNGQRRTKYLLEKTGLDPIMGSLVVLTLVDARLVTLHDEPLTELPTVALSDSTQVEPGRFAVPESDLVEENTSAEERGAREEIFALYMQLKPLSAPTDVLGVDDGASREQIERAYRERMRSLDPKRVPEGSARSLMVSRVEELRAKVQRAFELLVAREDTQVS